MISTGLPACIQKSEVRWICTNGEVNEAGAVCLNFPLCSHGRGPGWVSSDTLEWEVPDGLFSTLRIVGFSNKSGEWASSGTISANNFITPANLLSYVGLHFLHLQTFLSTKMILKHCLHTQPEETCCCDPLPWWPISLLSFLNQVVCFSPRLWQVSQLKFYSIQPPMPLQQSGETSPHTKPAAAVLLPHILLHC